MYSARGSLGNSRFSSTRDLTTVSSSSMLIPHWALAIAALYRSPLSAISGAAFFRIARASRQWPVEARSIPRSTESAEELPVAVFLDDWAPHHPGGNTKIKEQRIKARAGTSRNPKCNRFCGISGDYIANRVPALRRPAESAETSARYALARLLIDCSEKGPHFVYAHFR